MKNKYLIIAVIIISIAFIIGCFEIGDALRDLGESIGVGFQNIRYKQIY